MNKNLNNCKDFGRLQVKITGVDKNSLCGGKVFPGEYLVKINDTFIGDVIDYIYALSEPVLYLEILGTDGKKHHVKVKNHSFDDLGLTFDSFLMDTQRNCKNKCIFCFIDQLPKNLRQTLYFKDDDSRMSILYGNYITLTNFTESDVQRICDYKLSPLNISIHTTDPQLREFMLNNKNAGAALCHLDRFFAADIMMNFQIVVCPGVNDKKQLDKTISDLLKFMPYVQSIAVVPVGLTKFRDGLFPLTPFDQKTADETLALSLKYAQQCLLQYNQRIVYPADELYIKADKPLPDNDFYDDYPQLANGVGLMPLFVYDYLSLLSIGNESPRLNDFDIITGTAAAPFISELVAKTRELWHDFNCRVFPVENNFFGNTVDVAGLLTGTDIMSAITKHNLKTVMLPTSCLRHEGDLFLDGISRKEIEQETNARLFFVPPDGESFYDAIFYRKGKTS